MQRLEVSGAVQPIYGSLGVKRLRLLTAHAAQLRKEAETKSKLLPAAATLSVCAKPLYWYENLHSTTT